MPSRNRVHPLPFMGAYMSNDGMIEADKAEVRAGDVIRIIDLVPNTVVTETLDALRVFFITETQYKESSDTLTIQPDSFPRSLYSILARFDQIERVR